jgi:hypothetical protein
MDSTVKKFLAKARALGMMHGVIKEPEPPQIKKCLLPSCNVEIDLSNHKGYYCCREHCIEHKKYKI